jgi:protein gp37
MEEKKMKEYDEVWNYVTGCTPISEGCANCYAQRMAGWLAGAYGYPSDNPFRPGLIHQDKFDQPGKWLKPRRIAVSSMGDLFHSAVRNKTIRAVLAQCRKYERHTFIVLTKRAERLVDFAYPDNVWVGISAENQGCLEERAYWLGQVKAGVRFVTCEPLLSRLHMEMLRFRPDLVIAGKEKGPNARATKKEWKDEIEAFCARKGILFFDKQNPEMKFDLTLAPE